MSGLFRNIQEKAACEPQEEGSRGQGGLWLEVLAWWSAAVRLGWDGDESQGRMNPPGNPELGGVAGCAGPNARAWERKEQPGKGWGMSAAGRAPGRKHILEGNAGGSGRQSG